MDLFEQEASLKISEMPLAVRMRPRKLEEFVGQKHILGAGKLLGRLVSTDKITSLILYGPPGTGKTALAHIISAETSAAFENINAAISSAQDIKRVLAKAEGHKRLSGGRTIFFIDEIHRFNKAQQDILLPSVENGNPVLIGSTTHNPFFSINAALISRSQIFELRPLGHADLVEILTRALSDKERGYGRKKIKIDPQAIEHLAKVSDGDARRALSALELAVLSSHPAEDQTIHIDLQVAEESIQKKAVLYDADGDAHYDTISAFIKSMRGSDPDAALYWLAKMLEAGEDIRFIARRMAICAAEDVGNADPQALILANAAWQIAEMIGMPEARIVLAQAAVYIATAPKSNASYMGIEKALEDVKNNRLTEVPDYLKDASCKGAKRLKREGSYQYAHDYDEHYIDQEYGACKRLYYRPTMQGHEKQITEWMKHLKNKQAGGTKR